MPKRGGRKNHPKKGKGEGGAGAKFGRIRSNKNKKKAGKGPSKNYGTTTFKNIDVPELMDLEGNVYIPEIGETVTRSSMRNLSRRPGRHHLYEEVGYTDNHIEDTLRQPLRNRPIEFVKAKQVYDPSAELFKKLGKTESGMPKIHQDLLDSMSSPPPVGSGIPESPNVDALSEDSEDDAMENRGTNFASSHTSLDSDLLNRLEDVSNEEEDMEEDDAEEAEEEAEESEEEEDAEKDTEYTEDVEEKEKEGEEDRVSKIKGPENDDEESEINREAKRGEINEIENIDNKMEDIGPLVESMEESFVIDNTGDDIISKEYNTTKPITSLLIQNNNESRENNEISEGGVDYDPVLNIGKVSLQTKRDGNGQSTTELISVNQLNKVSKKGFVDEITPRNSGKDSYHSDDDFAGYKDYIAQVMRDGKHDIDTDEYESDTNFDHMASSSEADSEEEHENGEDTDRKPSEIEYGFLPEDYEFDVSQISISNVRFGIKNQFYTKCLELTGSDDQSMWIDEDDITEYVLLKGVKDHRLKSFFSFITKGLVDDDPFEVPNYSDVYISETSEEEEDLDNGEEENLEQMIAFTKSQQQSFMDLDIPQTETLKTRGKGRKKQLDLERMQLDVDIRESLQDQYQVHRQAKRNKKERREEAVFEEALRKHDLLIKYPYSLHIKDISAEFETFLHDSSRDSMNFPPLDPHGNKTIVKLSNFYNMKSLKCGGGLKLFIKVSKNRKTFHYLPRYDQIGNVLRQRPIFNRTDQKRPKDEITRTDGNFKKDRSRGRGKANVNAIREGDIVGASAPEIDSNNIGRKLLEKLGWTKGEGLGAHGNKGISEPVVAKIKKSKTGLK